jgi:flagellin
MTVIATNTTANSALNYLNRNSASQSNDLAQLASGSKITTAKDDASGLAVATGMASDASVLQQGATNLQNGTAVLNTADGALSNISDILTRMKTLAAQAQSGTSSSTDLGYMQDEYKQLAQQIDSIANNTTFNGTALLDGKSSYSNGTGMTFMVGTSSTDTLTVKLNGATANALGIDVTSLNGTSSDTDSTGAAVTPTDPGTDANGNPISWASAAMTALTTAINSISADRAQVGAQLSAMSFQSNVINTSLQNLNSAKSAISDADIAAVQSKFSTDQTMTSAAVSALSDANQMNQQILKLLG